MEKQVQKNPLKDSAKKETICALATCVGKSGIGIIRVSGSLSKHVAEKILRKTPKPRIAELLNFYNSSNEVLDQGIAIFFKAPNSFTGEDILEFQAHGGPVLLDLIVQEILSLGVRPARPGEFSERAFLNKKIDLTKAEAIADIINASSEKALLSANKSLQGNFAKEINVLVNKLIKLRVFVESSIDFPEEEIDFIKNSDVSERLLLIKDKVLQIYQKSKKGSVLREGLTAVIVGKPNVGKSSLLNLLSENNSAIVTDIPGTTRDVVKEHIQIDGIPLNILDTAGLRDAQDKVEQEGIKRTYQEIKRADFVLVVEDDTETTKKEISAEIENFKITAPKIFIKNKIDLSKGKVGIRDNNTIGISVKNKQGISDLKNKVKEIVGISNMEEGVFLARQRHLDALKNAQDKINKAINNLENSPELLAEDLRETQKFLGEITGVFTNDDLLGVIFESFCIGK